VARCLNSTGRGKNAAIVLDRWQQQRLPRLSDFLEANSGTARTMAGGQDPELTDALCGMTVAWLVSQPKERRVFDRLAGHLAAGMALLPEHVAACLVGGPSLPGLNAGWEQWVARQRQVVYTSTGAPLLPVGQLRAGLLLYPGDSGIPVTQSLPPRLTFRDLIERRDATWIPGFAARKSSLLRGLAVGKGAEFGAVVDAYAAFLGALGAQAEVAALERLLAVAERELDTFAAAHGVVGGRGAGQ
jgi:hypothetical protein